MNYQRLYEYRFAKVDQTKRLGVWKEISTFIFNLMGKPQVILDPAAGRCEFISSIDAKEKWVVDCTEYAKAYLPTGAKFILGDIRTLQFPSNHFDGVFVSNFLEHLGSQEEIASFLEKMFLAVKPGGKIAIMGPNFRYCFK